MKQPLPLLASVVLVLASPGVARATEILQNQFDAIAQIAAFQPIGQSFVAEATQVQVAIAFGFEEVNPGFPNEPLEMSLYQGEGLGGPLLSTVTFSLPNGFTGFFNVDFSSVLLDVGAVYTAAVSVPTSSPLWGVQFSTSDVYPFGRLVTDNSTFYEIFCGSATNTQCADLRFRVTSATIPEPGLWSLLLAIVFASSLKLRRRRHPLS
jgi:hypothetical protein